MGQGSGVKGQGYQQLIVWRKSHELALAIYRATSSLPRNDAWLRTQVNRSAVSVAANIAEGYSRGSLREYIQFLNIARGSLAETEYYLLFMRDSSLLTGDSLNPLQSLAAESARLLLGLLRSLRNKTRAGTSEPTRVQDSPVAYSVLDPVPSTLDPTEAK